MLGLATVLTEQGVEGVVPFVAPAPVRPKTVKIEQVPSVDEVSEISKGVWLIGGGIVAVMLASALGYWISAKQAVPARQRAAVTRPIQAPPRLQADAASAAPMASMPSADPPATGVPAKAAARAASESVFVFNPEWSSQVRRRGEVNSVTERSTMVVLDAIHEVQERARQQRDSVPKVVRREP